jgi:hypothetical protein
LSQANLVADNADDGRIHPVFGVCRNIKERQQLPLFREFG